MPKPFRHPLVSIAILIALVLGVVAAPAGASTALSRRAAVRAKRAQLASQLNTLKASDAQLAAAIRALDAQLSAQQAAAASAVAAQQAAEARLSSTEKEIQSLRTSVIKRAVDVYEHPRGPVTAISSTADINEASRRARLLQEVNGNSADALDHLRLIMQDLGIQRAALDRTRRDAMGKLSALNQTRAGQAKLAAALAARIHEYQAESDAQSAIEGSLSAQIRAEEAAARASRGGDGSFDGRNSSFGLIWPLSGPVTSGFGYRWGRMHQGIDIGVPIGTPIHAAKAGTVIFAGTMSGYGYVVIIDHGGSFSTLYAHQSRLASSQGEQVAQGQVIGYSGNTGHSTGPHLHFETRINGTAQDPRRYLP
jgi:murein DD-endopeptidase MepM/ murein hydrolase activator NlpD